MRRFRLFFFILFLLVATAASIGASSPRLSIRFFDVGQGDAAAVRLPDGTLLLVDSGPPGVDDLPGRLRSFGGSKLRTVFITHPHADHIAGFAGVLREFPTSYVYDTVFNHPSKLYEEALNALERAHGRLKRGRRGDIVSFGKVQVRFIHPDAADRPSDPNEASLVFIITYGSLRVLFTGDIGEWSEKRILSRGDPIRADLLKVAHHGSAGSSSPGFLAAVKPRLAVISVGARNDYGHPSPATITRLRKAGARVLRTDEHGDITVTSDGRTWSYRVQR